MTELEFYQTTKVRPGMDNWEYRLEVEQGLSERLDLAVYQIFSQNEGQSFRWDAVQFRMRYRLGQVGKYFFDPLLYFEYNRKLDSSAPNKAEFKLILSRHIQAINLSMNPVYEYFFAPGQEHELGYDVGLSYEFNANLIVGFESTSRVEFENDEIEVGSYVGPTLSVASGEWWYTMGVAFGITEHSDDLRVRLIMGIGL